MFNKLTHSLNEMIRHQRLAEICPAGSPQQNDHHREAMRHRLEASKLEKQIKAIRQSIAIWMNLN